MMSIWSNSSAESPLKDIPMLVPPAVKITSLSGDLNAEETNTEKKPALFFFHNGATLW